MGWALLGFHIPMVAGNLLAHGANPASTFDLDVNAEMIRQGWAVADTRFEVDRQAEYIKLWRKAQGGKLGLWEKDSQ